MKRTFEFMDDFGATQFEMRGKVYAKTTTGDWVRIK